MVLEIKVGFVICKTAWTEDFHGIHIIDMLLLWFMTLLITFCLFVCLFVTLLGKSCSRGFLYVLCL